MNLLLDTNVLIDYVGARKPFFDDAKKVFAAGYFGDAKLWVSAQSFKDTYYILSNYTDQKHVQQALRRCLDVVTTVSLSVEDAARGLFLEWDDYEDCLISLCATSAKVDFIVTRDKKGFARSSVPSLSPAAWLDMMKQEQSLEYDIVDLP